MANYALFTKLHRSIYKWSGGRIGNKLMGLPMVLMHTIGAKSGEIRSIPLACYPLLESGVIVIASNNGDEKHPAWLYNVRKNPEFDIQLGTEKRRVKAVELDDEKREVLWPQMAALNPRIEQYKEGTSRVIPIILLQTL